MIKLNSICRVPKFQWLLCFCKNVFIIKTSYYCLMVDTYIFLLIIFRKYDKRVPIQQDGKHPFRFWFKIIDSKILLLNILGSRAHTWNVMKTINSFSRKINTILHLQSHICIQLHKFHGISLFNGSIKSSQALIYEPVLINFNNCYSFQNEVSYMYLFFSYLRYFDKYLNSNNRHRYQKQRPIKLFSSTRGQHCRALGKNYIEVESAVGHFPLPFLYSSLPTKSPHPPVLTLTFLQTTLTGTPFWPQVVKVAHFPLRNPQRTFQNCSSLYQIKIWRHCSIFYLGKFLFT